MFKVTATANGYYGQKIRVPGEEFGIAKAEDFSANWMASDDPKLNGKTEAPEGGETRRVNTGGTDGVVGVDVPKAGAKLSAKERIALAESASGRTGLKAKEADEILAALDASGGSSNDDRSRDMASNPGDNAPTPDAADADAKDDGDI